MIDQELKQRALTPAAKGEAAPREKILKLGKKITDVVDHKLGKVRAEDAEYWGLAGVVTDEMADIALTMKLRTPYTVEELWKMNKVTEEQKPHFQELLDQMSYIGLLEYDYGYHYDHNGAHRAALGAAVYPADVRAGQRGAVQHGGGCGAVGQKPPAGAASGACQVL